MVGGLDSSSCSTVELKGISISLWFCIANISCNGLFYKLVQICSLIITSFSHHSQLSVCVCRIWLHLNLFYFCLSEHPACPSIPPWLFWQFHQPLLSVCLSCLGCVDSSSVSCRRSVLLRHGQWSDACTLSADGQVTILSHTFFPQKFILPISPLASSLSLSFSVICLHLHLPP